MSAKVDIVVYGGRVGDENDSRGQDICVAANGYRLPIRSLVLRVDGRKAVATVEMDVDRVELQNIEWIDGPTAVSVDQKHPVLKTITMQELARQAYEGGVRDHQVMGDRFVGPDKTRVESGLPPSRDDFIEWWDSWCVYNNHERPRR